MAARTPESAIRGKEGEGPKGTFLLFRIGPISGASRPNGISRGPYFRGNTRSRSRPRAAKSDLFDGALLTPFPFPRGCLSSDERRDTLTIHETPRVRRDDGPQLPDRVAEPRPAPVGPPAGDPRGVRPAGRVRPVRLAAGPGRVPGRRPGRRCCAARRRGRAAPPGPDRGGGQFGLLPGAGRADPAPRGGRRRPHRDGCGPRDALLLLTWNCVHIANASLRPRIEAACRAAGCEPPLICTPQELPPPEDQP